MQTKIKISSFQKQLAILGGALMTFAILWGGWKIISGLLEDVAEQPYVATVSALAKPFDTSVLESDIFKALVLFGPEKIEATPDGNPNPFIKK